MESMERVREQFDDYRLYIIDHFNVNSDELSTCLIVFDYLTDRRSFTLNYVTYGTLMQVTQYSNEQFPLLVKATDFLTTPKAYLLEMHFEFLDEFMEEPEPINPKDVHVALTEGTFYHPHTGITVVDFNKYIYPVFRPSTMLRTYRRVMSEGQ
ncbi:hypothetical protein KTC41_14405 [Vibrio cholerae]|nr:hypothetical protein KTC41_14405 [Vibrio cholerae]